MKHLSTAILGLFLTATAWAADEWQVLFNGKDLSGWLRVADENACRVSDGAISLDGGRSDLFYVGEGTRADFKNFELKAEVRTEPRAVGGIFFHIPFHAGGDVQPEFGVRVANSLPAAAADGEVARTGSLCGIRNLCKALVKDNEWFRMRIAVRGKRVQVRLNDLLVVDYLEPENPVVDPAHPGRRLGHGTFALQCGSAGSKVWYKNILLKPLPDELPEDPGGPLHFDAVDEQLVKLAAANYPLVDFHTHLKGGLTVEQVVQQMLKTGINHGIAANCGLGFPITDDAGIDAFLKTLAGRPVFVGMQAEGREWPTLFSPAAVARFDYVFTDSMTIFDHKGKRTRLWIKDEVEIPDKQAFMDHLVDTAVKILNEEPIDIYVNPTFLPDLIAKEYDTLWTPQRMQRVVDAAAKNGVAIELNSRLRLPGLAFVKLAKQAGLKFTLGINNTDTDTNLGRAEYALEMIRECGLTSADFWMPKPDGRKPIQVQRR